jgi:hypothetical protein
MKFGFHHPTYRQQDWFAQSGWFPSRSTCNDLINYAVEAALPLYLQMWSLLLSCPILYGDDTRLRLLSRNALTAEQLARLEGRKKPGGKSGEGSDAGHRPAGFAHQLCLVLRGAGRRGAVRRVPVVLDSPTLRHRYASGRLPRDLRGRCRWCQCAPGVPVWRSDPPCQLQCACTSGIREGRSARTGVGFAGALVLPATVRGGRAWEAAGCGVASGLAAAGRGPGLATDAELAGQRAVKRVLPKGPMGEALGYLRNQWSALQVYLTDGRIPIDNDHSEQRIRPLTIGRNNWLFLGHPAAAPGRLQLYSLVSSAQRHHLVLQDYLEDVLRKLAEAQQRHPGDLELAAPICWNCSRIAGRLPIPSPYGKSGLRSRSVFRTPSGFAACVPASRPARPRRPTRNHSWRRWSPGNSGGAASEEATAAGTAFPLVTASAFPASRVSLSGNRRPDGRLVSESPGGIPSSRTSVRRGRTPSAQDAMRYR